MRLLLIACLLTPFNLFSQKDCLELDRGEIILTEKREVDPFSGVELRIEAEVITHIGEYQKVTIKSDMRIVEQIKTETVDGTLIIDWKKCVDQPTKITIHVTAKKFGKLESTGKGKIREPN